MIYSQKYTIVHFISPIENDVQFQMSDWPLHITLADVFAVDRHDSTIDSKLTALLSEITIVKTKAMNDGTLGTAPVVLLEKTSQLQQLHSRLIELLKENGADFNNPEFTNDGFIPHSTIQKNSRLNIGEYINIDSLSIVDMLPDGNWQQRKVLATFGLKRP